MTGESSLPTAERNSEGQSDEENAQKVFGRKTITDPNFITMKKDMVDDPNKIRQRRQRQDDDFEKPSPMSTKRKYVMHPLTSLKKQQEIQGLTKNKINNEQNVYEQQSIDSHQSGIRYRVTNLIKKFFAKFGILIAVGFYIACGGALFSILEQHEEIRLCNEGQGYDIQNITKYRTTLINYISFNFSSTPVAGKDNETVANKKVDQILESLRNRTITIYDETGFNGGDCDSQKRWTFANALMFSVTVVSTIGYGNISPVTWEGRIVCICYATIGIPLFVMSLANLSGLMGNAFRYCYSRIFCFCCLRQQRRKNKLMEEFVKENDLEEIPFNELEYHVTDEQQLDTLYKINNIALADGIDLENYQAVTVPLTVSMFLIAGYVMFGAFIFKIFEGWDLLASAYFCYITLSTVGFGDFVPGQSTDDEHSTIKLVVGAIYALIGMAVLGMSYDLMQEEIVAKAKWISKNLSKKSNKSDDPPTNLKSKLSIVEKDVNSPINSKHLSDIVI
ncbi:hypothetical protein SNEBB_001327 [Seison nebaliae]|nr:hypothetical protein SNEBB_001327 [Seison nebaliae]